MLSDDMLHTLSDDHLIRLKQEAENTRRKIELIQLKRKVEKEIDQQGFFLDVKGEIKKFRRDEFNEYEHNSVDFRCTFSTYRKRTRYNSHIDIKECSFTGIIDRNNERDYEWLDEQPDHILSYWFTDRKIHPQIKYGTPLINAPYDLEISETETECGDGDDPLEGTVYISVIILFKKPTFPPPGKYYFLNFSDNCVENILIYDDRFKLWGDYFTPENIDKEWDNNEYLFISCE